MNQHDSYNIIQNESTIPDFASLKSEASWRMLMAQISIGLLFLRFYSGAGMLNGASTDCVVFKSIQLVQI